MQHQSVYQNNNTQPVIVSETDFALLHKLLGNSVQSANDFSLLHELNRAIVVKKEAFPPHAIGINSTVCILDLESQTEKTFTLVMPVRADIRNGLVSVLSPMGTALIGFREGETVSWQMPGGLKHFRITRVINDATC